MGPDILHTQKRPHIWHQGHHPDALLLATIWWWPSIERVSFYWAGGRTGRWSHTLKMINFSDKDAGQWRRQPYTLPSWQSPSPSPVRGKTGICLECFKRKSWSKSLQASGCGKASSGFARFSHQEPSPLSSLHTRSEGKGISNKHQRKYRRLEFITMPLINDRSMAKMCKIQANGKYMNIISHQCNDREMFQVCKKDDGCPSNCIAKGQHCETIREER